MSTSILTSKGQTTIPQDIRNYLGIQTGDKLEFLINKEGQVVVTPLTVDVSQLKGILPKPKKKVSIEKMNAVIIKRGGKNERD